MIDSRIEEWHPCFSGRPIAELSHPAVLRKRPVPITQCSVLSDEGRGRFGAQKMLKDGHIT